MQETNVAVTLKHDHLGAVKLLSSRLFHEYCHHGPHSVQLIRVRGGMGMYDIDDNDPRLKRLLENQVKKIALDIYVCEYKGVYRHVCM
jgi:hypothetical protein